MRAAIAQHLRGLPTPRAQFSSLHETLIIAGVATVLVIRTQLWLTNYPQLGGHGLHIAHLLWGGLFMLLAIGLLLTFLGKAVLRAAAVVGGVGFGFFIDELALRDRAILDAAATVAADVERLRAADAIPARTSVSGHVYDVTTGLVQTIVRTT